MANMFIDLCNFLLDGIKVLFSTIMSFLPDSPFLNVSLGLTGDFVGYMNWIFPFKTMTTILLAWLACVLVYYVYSVILRFIKAIE